MLREAIFGVAKSVRSSVLEIDEDRSQNSLKSPDLIEITISLKPCELARCTRCFESGLQVAWLTFRWGA